MADTKPKRRMGDRRDGRWVRDVPGLQTIMGHLMPNRTDAEVFMKDSFDVTELLPYLDAKNATHPDYKTTVFHALIMSVARMLKERPKMNYFIQGRRMYERYDSSLSFVCKRRFQDNGEEALMCFIPKEDETLDSMSYKIAGEVRETRKSESSTDGIDALVDGFAKIPRVLLMGVIRVIRWMDLPESPHRRRPELFFCPALESRQHPGPGRLSPPEQLRHQQHHGHHRHHPQGSTRDA